IQQTMRFPLANGFPVITERSIASFWRKPIGELCAFINGATTLEDLREFGCDWWDAWATEEKTSRRGLPPGDIGPGSYGGAFHDFPTSEGPGFDQFAHLVEQLRELPADRTHFVSPWIPQYQTRGAGKLPRSTIAPCHGWVHVRILNGRLHLHMFQRSGDVPVGVPSNMVQYAALALMLEQLTDFEPAVYYLTTGHVVVAGRLTQDSIAARLSGPLPGRTTIVVTRQPHQPDSEQVRYAPDLPTALDLARTLETAAGGDEVFVIGGAQIYTE